MTKTISIAFIILMLAVLLPNSTAQNMIRANPADIMDPQAMFINPAIIPYRNLTLSLGMKVYHLGFLDDNSTGLKYSYSSNSFPNLLLDNIGVGVTLESFNTPYFRTGGIGASFAYSILPSLAVGVSAHGNNLSYDEGKFSGFDHSDPVFANGNGQWNLSFDAGMLIRPTDNFAVGLSCNNLNRPDLSLINGGARVPLELNFGMKHYFNIFAASLFGHYESNDLALGVMGEVNFGHRGLLKAGYATEGLLLEGLLNLGNGFAINYRMDYPTSEVNNVSFGSHQVGVSWNLRLNPEYNFAIRASVDTVKVIREVSQIKINKKENREQIFAQLDDEDLKFPRPGKGDLQATPIEDSGMSLDDILNETLPHNKYLDEYRKNFEEMRAQVQKSNQHLNVDICFPDATTAERSVIIRNFLVDSLNFSKDDIHLLREPDGNNHTAVKDSIKNQVENSPDRDSKSEYITISSAPRESMEPNQIYFNINVTGVTKVNKWRVLITNFLGEPVHEILGSRNIETEVAWDGFTADNRLIDVGNYYYQFQYSIGGDKWIPKNPRRHRLVFVQLRKYKVIEITTDNKISDLDMLKAIVIRLKTPPPMPDIPLESH
ncbi:MAG: type IX secretion system membrane protein PorP/SprF [candidate division KSB1 bacterium]|nr:type IX secretion system membrane protein PorP/SprF [candidate division KSB1 bacterium]